MSRSDWTNHFSLLRQSGLSVADLEQQTNARLNFIKENYGKETISPRTVISLIEQSVINGKGLSVIRLGDIMALLLNDSLPREAVLPFQGLPIPVPRDVFQQVRNTVLTANIVGVSHYPASCALIKRFMLASSWQPPYLTDSYINDQLYVGGYLKYLIKKYRVALVGRAAQNAALRLRQEGLQVALSTSLDNYSKLPRALTELNKTRPHYDLVLVGAGVPGRILCGNIAKRLQAPAIEIGHMMDALADPVGWLQHPMANRKKIKEFWMKVLDPKSASSAIKPMADFQGNDFYVIKTGDTLFNLAKSFNISLNSLMAANPNVNPNDLKVGQKINIPK